jgi:hypothetical protein
MNTRKFRNLFVLAAASAMLLSCPMAQAGYIDNGDGTVTDNGTGLMWQQATAPGTYTWQQALAYCENLDLAGYTDWRLPTVKELESLADYSRYIPAINTTYFPDTVASLYWSSTTFAYSTNYAWYLNFLVGCVYLNYKSDFNYVRAVRSGQSGSFDNLTLWPVPDTGQAVCYDSGAAITCPTPGQAFYGQDASYSINTPAYTKLAAGGTALPDNATSWLMVRDEVIGLVWEEKQAWDNVTNYTDPNDADNYYTWYDSNPATNGGAAGTPGAGTDTEDCINALNTANYGGYSDWRMPTVKELQSIVDYSSAYPGPTINTTYFPNTVASYYWSSTPLASSTSYAWYVDFYYGNVNYYVKSDFNYVRAVRSGQSGSFDNLVISKLGAGSGTVTSADGNIDCGSDCTEKYPTGTEVTLTAAAAFGSTFTGWSGGGCSGAGQCVLTIPDNVTVTAYFNLVPTTTTTVVTTTTVQPITTTSQPTTTTTAASTSSSTTTTIVTITTTQPTTTTTQPSVTTTISTGCIDTDGDGYGVGPKCAKAQDCNDADKVVHPEAEEICGDGIDNNCNGLIDEVCDGKKCPFVNLLGDGNPNLVSFRFFRDKTLAKNAIGRKIIAIYYNNAGSINAALERSPALRSVARNVLETIAPMVGR